MDLIVDTHSAKTFLIAIVFAQARILGMFLPLPVFNRNILPGMLRMGVATGLSLMVAPTLMPALHDMDLGSGQFILLMLKEAFIGFVLGCLIAVPFWAFEAIGFLVDNQRGASIAATLNPLTGNDSSPLGILFNQAFIVFFFISGGFLLMVDVLYASFRLWDVLSWWPTLRPGSMPVFIEEILKLVRLGLLFAAPAVVAMFLAEVGLALISRFVPQLQVFFLAMPIKSALAMLILMLYMMTLFEYAKDMILDLHRLVPLLDEHWRAPAEGGR